MDKYGNIVSIGDILKFKEDRYTTVLGVVENILDNNRAWITIVGGGGTGNRTISLNKSIRVTKLED